MRSLLQSISIFRMREIDERDARLVHLYLTDRGRSLHELIEEELKRLQERAPADLTREESRHLESAFTKIIRNLERTAPAGDEAPE